MKRWLKFGILGGIILWVAATLFWNLLEILFFKNPFSQKFWFPIYYLEILIYFGGGFVFGILISLIKKRKNKISPSS